MSDKNKAKELKTRYEKEQEDYMARKEQHREEVSEILSGLKELDIDCYYFVGRYNKKVRKAKDVTLSWEKEGINCILKADGLEERPLEKVFFDFEEAKKEAVSSLREKMKRSNQSKKEKIEEVKGMTREDL